MDLCSHSANRAAARPPIAEKLRSRRAVKAADAVEKFPIAAEISTELTLLRKSFEDDDLFDSAVLFEMLSSFPLNVTDVLIGK